MRNTQISNEEVKKYFLVANAGKSLFESRSNDFGLEEGYKRILDEIFGLTEEELDERITDKFRLTRYDHFEWYQGQLPLSEIGSWPKMHSLDVRLTTGNILETVRDIKKVMSGDFVLPYEDKQEEEKRTNAFSRFLEKSRSIRDNLDFIYERFPIILFPGGEVREKDYNPWARKNNAPLCEIFKHDLDDGNNRAVSYALEGIIQAPCFYGKSLKYQVNSLRATPLG